MSNSARTAFTTTVLMLFLFTLVASNGCDKIGKGLTKLVLIEYDQSLNFTEFEFANSYSVDKDPVVKEWRRIRLHDFEEKRKGVWMTYLICTVTNNAPKAVQFDYDVSKFYVDYGNRKHFYRDLAPGIYESTFPAQGGNGGQFSTEVLAPFFRSETQVGPDTHSFTPNSDQTVNNRIVIYVSTELGDLTDLTKLNQRLFYDGHPVDMVSRKNDTVAANGVVTGSSLPTGCRPPRK